MCFSKSQRCHIKLLLWFKKNFLITLTLCSSRRTSVSNVAQYYTDYVDIMGISNSFRYKYHNYCMSKKSCPILLYQLKLTRLLCLVFVSFEKIRLWNFYSITSAAASGSSLDPLKETGHVNVHINFKGNKFGFTQSSSFYYSKLLK